MTHYANRERQRESMIYWRSYNRALHFTQVLFSRSANLQNCYSVKNRALLYLDFSFTDSPPFILNRSVTLRTKTDFLHLDFRSLIASSPFSRTVPLKMTLPFFMWSFPPLILSPMFQQNCYPAKTQPLYSWIFFGLMTI